MIAETGGLPDEAREWARSVLDSPGGNIAGA
jgi:hypothetical protein